MLPAARASFSGHTWRILVILAFALVLCESAPRAQTQSPSATIVIHARKFQFSPIAITLKKGETVKLVLISDDVRHSLSVKGLAIRSDIVPGRHIEVIVTPAQVGDFPGACSVYCGSGHRSMEFMVHVVE
jgi:cytochrome c oxidase subunit II